MSIAIRLRQGGVMAVVWLFYFGVLIFAALPRGLNSPSPEGIFGVARLGLWADTDEWIQAFGRSDPGSYAKAGREIATTGWVKEPFYEVAWPPGEYLLHAALLRLHAPVPLSLIVLGCGLWACAWLQFFCFARRRLHPALAAALPLALLATELMRHYFLRGWGPCASEGPSCALLILGFGFLVLALEPLARPTGSAPGDLRRTLGAGCCSGLTFALAAYVRAHMELVLTLLSLAFLAAALVSVAVAVRRAGLRPVALLRCLRLGWWQSGLLALAVVLVSFHACTMPYRVLHNYRKHGSWEWTSGYSYVWALMWRDPATVPAGATFVVEGGGQAPGILAADWHVDAGRLTPPEARALTLRLIRERPGAWLRYKLPILARYWFARNRTEGGRALFGRSYRENGVILLGLLVAAGGCAGGLFRARFAPAALWLLTFTACVAAVSVGPPMVFHFEVRYLFPLKVFGLFLLPYCVVLTLRARGIAPQAPGCPERGEEAVHDNTDRNPERRGPEVARRGGVCVLE